MHTALLPLTYLPNVYWFSIFLKHPHVLIEQAENFRKGTFRNRCEIAGANGRILLSIPLKGGRDHHRLFKETEIDYTIDWQRNHWQSISSAYGSSPFFEHYQHYFTPHFKTEEKQLFNFNLSVLNTILSVIKTQKDFDFTNTYEKLPLDKFDFRDTKQQNSDFCNPHYIQPFEPHTGFMYNLSIIDLIFNLGPSTKNYLIQL